MSLANKKPEHDDIAVRAYLLFLKGGYKHGNDLADWFQAEKDLQIEMIAAQERLIRQIPEYPKTIQTITGSVLDPMRLVRHSRSHKRSKRVKKPKPQPHHH